MKCVKCGNEAEDGEYVLQSELIEETSQYTDEEVHCYNCMPEALTNVLRNLPYSREELVTRPRPTRR